MKRGRYYKMPQWAIQRIEAIADAYEVSYTEALLRCLDQGSKWHRKNIQRQINRDFDWEPKKPGVVIETIPSSQDEWDKDIQRTLEIAKTKWAE